MSEAEWKTRKERIDRWLKSLPLPWEITRLQGLKFFHSVDQFTQDGRNVKFAFPYDQALPAKML